MPVSFRYQITLRIQSGKNRHRLIHKFHGYPVILFPSVILCIYQLKLVLIAGSSICLCDQFNSNLRLWQYSAKQNLPRHFL